MKNEESSISSIISSLNSISAECSTKMSEIKANKQKASDEIYALRNKLNSDI